MKVLYSQLKKYLPDLKADAKEVAGVFTMTGFMIDKFLDVEYDGKKDYFLDLEVRQNRADSLGVIGLARELSAYYDIPLKLPIINSAIYNGDYKLPIEIRDKKAVKRLKAIKITNITISKSPDWLIQYLALYDINSINNLVDLTNYVMLETAFPSHAFDTDLVKGDKLIWERDAKYKKVTTLAGEELDLTTAKDLPLVITDGQEVLSMSMIGGQKVAINEKTKNIILEIGVYDGGLVRKNGRQLKVFTEAGSRLEKYLDPDGIDFAMDWLTALIIEHCGGEVASEYFDDYPAKDEKPHIKVRLKKVSQVAGIEISTEESKTYLKRLGFEIVSEGLDELYVKRPINRLDIEQEEDVFEEIIRLKGFYNIPKNNIVSGISQDITPHRLKLIDKLNNILSNRGFDEVRSWVLVDEKKNAQSNFQKLSEIKVINSINEEVPSIRQSIATNLFSQLEEYKKNNIVNIKIFEIGKVFGAFESSTNNSNDNNVVRSNDGKVSYAEFYNLGLLIDNINIDELKIEVENLLGSMGFDSIIFGDITASAIYKIPETAHPKTIWVISVGDNEKNYEIGVIYLSNKTVVGEASVAELNLTKIDEVIHSKVAKVSSTKEIIQKVVTLDCNLILKDSEDITKRVAELTNRIPEIWEWLIIDRYVQTNGTSKYTVRVSYIDLSDQDAKELHEKIFALK